MIKDLITKTRTFRRFDENELVDIDTLKELVDLARLGASAANRQPLKYFLSNDPANNEKIFPLLKWAGYLTEWSGPKEGERPTAYIVVLGDTLISPSSDIDLGIAIQSIRLGSTEKGLGGCVVASFNRSDLQNALDIPDYLDPLSVLAIGVPKEKIVLEKMGDDGDIKYWRDGEGVHHVPKRSLEEIIIE